MASALLLTEDEAAEQLRLCTRTLRRERQAGRLPYILIGRSVRYTIADLEAFVEASRQDQAPCQSTNTRSRRTPQAKLGQVIPFTQRLNG